MWKIFIYYIDCCIKHFKFESFGTIFIESLSDLGDLQDLTLFAYLFFLFSIINDFFNWSRSHEITISKTQVEIAS